MKNPIAGFISKSQFAFISSLCRGEEGDHFRDKLQEIASLIEKTPVTYTTEGAGPDRLAMLHYFGRSYDFYLIEKDSGCSTDKPEDFQMQAYGLVSMAGNLEFGYVSLPEIFACGLELDLYFTPTPVDSIREKILNQYRAAA